MQGVGAGRRQSPLPQTSLDLFPRRPCLAEQKAPRAGGPFWVRPRAALSRAAKGPQKNHPTPDVWASVGVDETTIKTSHRECHETTEFQIQLPRAWGKPGLNFLHRTGFRETKGRGAGKAQNSRFFNQKPEQVTGSLRAGGKVPAAPDHAAPATLNPEASQASP